MAKGIAVGLNKGFITTKLNKKFKREQPSRRKGSLGKRVALVRQTVRELTGFAPYEKRIIELIKAGSAKDSKKATKIARKRLGTHRRAKVKRALLEEAVKQQRKK
ncbi:hypothetical protein IMG5_125120 [Ichthyophthirius multifiliis]|uniref:60S ribosomal protein L36 n=1 Tax=Ichthyophthirius multifiliis TaxID=5932 RepID=G0QVP9_ICHMU|nr:hypothetical protein IMG5_125120 [Ichthyophthirius multifiliis]EGR30710.1 hypothetical protein IMG5_125120 [Ichthyophthirius multifiliis]|eukprot:XP_004032297.1 hypothetical protein IMG5_125120 [Ichthyophthirius multifiliis]